MRSLLDRRAHIAYRTRMFVEFDDIIDAHSHVGVTWPDERTEPTPEESIAMLDRSNVKKACTSASRYLKFDYRKGNRLTRSLVERFPDRLIGFCIADPTCPEESAGEIESCLEAPHFAGVKIHISHNGVPYDDPRYLPIFERARDFGAPVLAHAFSRAEVSQFLSVAKAFPEIAFIVGHSGGYAWRDCVSAIASVENAFFDVCCSVADAGRVEAFVEAGGADRVLLGTDIPFLSPAYNISQIYHADLSHEQRALILGGNTRRILGARA